MHHRLILIFGIELHGKFITAVQLASFIRESVGKVWLGGATMCLYSSRGVDSLNAFRDFAESFKFFRKPCLFLLFTRFNCRLFDESWSVE